MYCFFQKMGTSDRAGQWEESVKVMGRRILFSAGERCAVGRRSRLRYVRGSR